MAHQATSEAKGDRMATQLRRAGLRPTRQRVALGRILFARGHRHICAEDLHEEAQGSDVRVSLATIYNTLHQFTAVGLLREVAIDGGRTYFDTNVTDHHHFFLEEDDSLLDIPGTEVIVGKTPEAPEGYEVARVDIVVRLRKKGDNK
jgi:Fur family iron response transcriptional regulator